MTAEDWHLLGFTTWIAALSTAAILPFGLLTAWVLARNHWPGKALLETLITLPLVLPPVATGLILLRLFGRRGWLGSLLAEQFGTEIVFTWRAVLIALGVMSFPLLVRSARTAFEGVDPRLEQMARSLGAGEPAVFLRITLPLAARGVIAGMLLAFARALGEFGATVVIAGNIPGVTQTLALSIFQSIQLGDDAHAWRLVGASAVLALSAVWTSAWCLRPAKARS